MPRYLILLLKTIRFQCGLLPIEVNAIRTAWIREPSFSVVLSIFGARPIRLEYVTKAFRKLYKSRPIEINHKDLLNVINVERKNNHVQAIYCVKQIKFLCLASALMVLKQFVMMTMIAAIQRNPIAAAQLARN